MRKTKIICTLGPAVDSDERITQIINAGMDCARLNFSHGTHEEQEVRLNRVRRIAGELNRHIPILLDTKGPEIRLKDFEGGSVIVEKGSLFTFDTDKETPGTRERIGLTYDKLAKNVEVGTKILVDDGKIELKVTAIKGSKVICKVITGGKLSNHKSINIPNVEISMPYLNDVDKSDLLFGIEHNVEYIAASFVRCADDLKKLRKFLKDNGGQDIKIISKIENGQGINNFDEILELSDGIMVARGDMGVEINFEKIPAIQKMMIEKCNREGKIVVTATQMLESMTENPRPTRAEVSDVANAIYDGTTVIMLSGESAAGRHPVEAVRTMANIAVNAENTINYYEKYVDSSADMEPNLKNAICASAYNAAKYLDAKAIVVLTRSGATANILSRFHPECPVIAATISERGRNQLNLVWGITPVAAENLDSADKFVEYAVSKAVESRLVKRGDNIVVILASDLESDDDTMRICTI
ncbi:pyruvate kinase [Eshraghiella crossota CAG:259]|jgi:pyruvate kinase|uniref:Pyruvate kinase n=1 Tax=Eshraghiella crossota CAG:259 TaxID=1263062 RepID=R5LAA5_9FIRM|nr:pyruvate kinase [Butyrivibrio crossotus CAG:259]